MLRQQQRHQQRQQQHQHRRRQPHYARPRPAYVVCTASILSILSIVHVSNERGVPSTFWRGPTPEPPRDPPDPSVAALSALAGTVFVPGTLNLTRAAASARCYADPVLYEEYFRTSAFRTVSEAHGLVLFHVLKAGSSMARTKMGEFFPDSKFRRFDRPTGDYNRTRYRSFLKFGFARDPFSRFVSAFQETLHRWHLRRGEEEQIPAAYQAFWESIESLEYTRDRDGVLKALETFVLEVYDGYRLANNHLGLQSTQLQRREYPELVPDVLHDLDDAPAFFARLKREKNVTVQSAIPDRYYAAKLRLDTSLLRADVVRKICQLHALDYCCLNFALPPECAGAVRCRWRDPRAHAHAGDAIAAAAGTAAGIRSAALQIEAVSPFPFPLRVRTEEFYGDPAAPAVAWLLSYPAGPDTVADGVRFLVHNRSLDRPDRPGAFLLEHTHCGPVCAGCGPYDRTTAEFLRACAPAGPHGHSVLDRVRRAIRIVDNPLDAVIGRYEFFSPKNPGAEGLRQHCRSWKTRFERDLSRVPHSSEHSATPCFGEFHRWTEWHNQAHKAVHLLGIPSLVVHGENYTGDDNGAVRRFLDLPAAAPRPSPGSEARPQRAAPRDHRDYFSPGDLVDIERLVRAYATKATWREVGHYFGGVPDTVAAVDAPQIR